MNTKKSKIEYYYSLRPSEYPIIETLHMDQEVTYESHLYQLSLVITFRPLEDSEKARLILSFSKVREVNLNFGPAALQVSSLNIIPLDNQWEEVNYKVFEAEQDADFSFLCSDFTATIL